MRSRHAAIFSVVIPLSLGTAGLISYEMAGAVPALPQAPRDPHPNHAPPPTDAERQLQAVVAITPEDGRAAQDLAKLQESRGAIAEAEATLRRSAGAAPGESARWQALAALYRRAGQFKRAVETLEWAAERDPSNASAQHLIATYYFAKLSDPTLRQDERSLYMQHGIAAEERALAAKPDFFDALLYESLLLREQAQSEPNSSRRTTLMQQADDLRSRATSLGPAANATSPEIDAVTDLPEPPPPPAVPGAGDIAWVYAETSFVAADGTSAPRKIKDVRPVYPPMVMRLGVEGRVIVHAAIDQRGHVVGTRVIESIPLLNQSVVDAVRQWRFDPLTVPSGTAPVLIEVQARFFPDR